MRTPVAADDVLAAVGGAVDAWGPAATGRPARATSAMVRVTPPDVRGHHTFGPADPEASAAMGVLETVVHTADVTRGLGLAYQPDPALCDRVLARLFPDVEPAPDPWTTLQWATGRTALPGRPRRVDWRWSNAAP